MNSSKDSGQFTNILSHFQFFFPKKKNVNSKKNVSNEQKILRPNTKIVGRKIQNRCKSFRMKKIFGRTRKFFAEDLFVRETFAIIQKK